MIDVQSLESAGYRAFTDHSVTLKGAPCRRLWQKAFKDADGVRYYLNVFEWDLKGHYPGYAGPSPSFEAEVQFRDDAVDYVNASLPAGNRSLEETEAFFARMWESMGFVHASPRGAPGLAQSA